MIHLTGNISIKSDFQTVWKALTDPQEVLIWNNETIQLLSPGEDYPSPGKTYRWKYRLAFLSLDLFDTPLEVTPARVFALRCRMIFLEWEEIFHITAVEDTAHVRLDMNMTVHLSVVGSIVERLLVRPLTSNLLHQHLQDLRRYCEQKKDSG